MGDRDRIWSFQRPEYWNDRYQKRLVEEDFIEERKFDWLCSFEAVRTLIDPHLRGARTALDIGCGNADFAAAVSTAYPQLSITGVDYSPVLFDLAGTSLGPHGRTAWLVMDACRMAFRDGAFDVVLDKGCLDALCAGYDQLAVLRGWGRDITPAEEAQEAVAVAAVARLLSEVERCLAPGGRYVVISYEGPPGRERFWADALRGGSRLRLVASAVEEESHNYLYVFTKGEEEAGGGAGAGGGAAGGAGGGEADSEEARAPGQGSGRDVHG
ncbi:hypothetical protein HYH03_000986 [Edaphochlamys debaryana]|uniref:Methyltransferase domain-containing protein n=1 Tax=Edaphochlamys debaryana TaxID=47281 RepID=A0A835YHQ8_9CHLO|nr:hypothetical protein HYH03_000986 [Edaphochlamys debaryana]|eukprot:KAG2501171.1 hypothetical protein HYH03_000986 [Edaphochlamys debaryana]